MNKIKILPLHEKFSVQSNYSSNDSDESDEILDVTNNANTFETFTKANMSNGKTAADPFAAPISQSATTSAGINIMVPK